MGTNTAVNRSRDRRGTSEALVLIGHGSHLSHLAAQPVIRHADRIRGMGVFDEVRTSFWKGEPSPREVLRTIGSATAYVVPMLMSEGYFTQHVIPRELGLLEGGDPATDASVRYTDPIGTHPSLTDVIVHRATSIPRSQDQSNGFGLVVVGHGTERSPESATSTIRHANRVRRIGLFSEVQALFLDEPPYVADITDHVAATDLIVVPLFVAHGPHTTTDIPRALGLRHHAAGTQTTSDQIGDRTIWYTDPVGTHDSMATVILERARGAGASLNPSPSLDSSADSINSIIEALVTASRNGVQLDGLDTNHTPSGFRFTSPTMTQTGLTEGEFRSTAAHHPAYVTNWFHWTRRLAGLDHDYREFLRWLERAHEWSVPKRYTALTTPRQRQWGQLAVTVRITQRGTRRYSVRNQADTTTDSLERLQTPIDVRNRVRFDDDGRYRPLPGAQTLPTGWMCGDIDGPALVQTIEFVYPASITNWYREATDRLDVTHYRDAASRHTGRYGRISEVPTPDLTAAVTSVCGDCTRRRVWEESEDKALGIDQGPGNIPCREPCSFFIEGVRSFYGDDGGTASGSDGCPPVGAFDRARNRYRDRYRDAKPTAGNSPPEVG